MDKYHIYEEIGKGEFSQVYKGREKTKITYVAIKRVDKSVMPKIVNEVQTMHKMQSPHILRFYDWYETTNNLWLILEYCPGSDLKSILSQDDHLPESSITMFGLDILCGLKYMHGFGFLHCDIQPKNLLIDEFGIIKIADFKFARKFPKAPIGDVPISQRGYLPSLAPELLQSDGVHSVYSDFWAVGCLLYELRRGVPPFGNLTDKEDVLTEKICHFHPLRANQSSKLPIVSGQLMDLIEWMLEKSPIDRCTWDELLAHSFWGEHSCRPPNNLPIHHSYEEFARNINRCRREQLEEVVLHEMGDVGNHISEAPPLSVLESTPIRPKGKGRQENGASNPSTSGVSSVSKPNFGNNLTVTPTTTRRRIGKGDSDGDSDDLARAFRCQNNGGNSDDNGIASTVGTGSSQHSGEGSYPSIRGGKLFASMGIEKGEKFVDVDFVEGSHGVTQGGQHTPQRNNSNNISHTKETPLTSRPYEHPVPLREESWDTNEIQSFAVKLRQYLFLPADVQVKPLVGNKTIEYQEPIEFRSEALPFTIEPVADLFKQPPNQLEQYLTLIYKSLHRITTLIFSSEVDDVSSLFSSSKSTCNVWDESLNVLGYLASISTSTEVANIILNTNFLHILLKILKSSDRFWKNHASGGLGDSPSIRVSSIPQKVMVARILGILLRYATIVQSPDARSAHDHLLSAFVNIMKSCQDSLLLRKTIAATGEMIFYIVAQDEESASANKDGSSSSAVEASFQSLSLSHLAIATKKEKEWPYLKEAIEFIVVLFFNHTDEIVRHYAIKTCENILGQGAFAFKARLCRLELAIRLCDMLSHPNSSEAFLVSCLSALSQMLLLSVSHRSEVLGCIDSSIHEIVLTQVLSSDRLRLIMERISSGSPKLQQVLLNLCCLCFYSWEDRGHSIVDRPLSEDGNVLQSFRLLFTSNLAFLNSILKLVEQSPSFLLRQKALVLFGLTCIDDPSVLCCLPDRRFSSVWAKFLESSSPAKSGSLSSAGVSSSGPNTTTATSTNPNPIPTSLVELALLFSRIFSTLLLQQLLGTHRFIQLFLRGSLEIDGSRMLATQELSQRLEILKALFVLGSPISLRRHIFPWNSFAILISAYLDCAHDLQQFVSLAHQQHWPGALEIEGFLSLSLESLTQLDLFPSLAKDEDCSDSDLSFGESMNIWSLYGEKVIPFLFTQYAFATGDGKVVLMAAIRRLFPFILRGWTPLLATVSSFMSSISSRVAELWIPFFSTMSSALQEGSPLPQYALKCLVDVLPLLEGWNSAIHSRLSVKNSPNVEKYATIDVRYQLQHCHYLDILCDQWNLQLQRSEEGFPEEIDVSMLTLMRYLLDYFHDRQEEYFVRLPSLLMSSLVHTFQSVESQKSTNAAAMIAGDSCSRNTSFSLETAGLEVFLNILDLIHVILNYSIRMVATQYTGNVEAIDVIQRWIVPLLEFLPTALQILGYAQLDGHHHLKLLLGENFSMLPMLWDVSSRCIGILFDLHPDRVANSLTNRKAIGIFASVIGSDRIDLKIRLRVLKTISGILRVNKNESDLAATKAIILDGAMKSTLISFVEKKFPDVESAEAKKVLDNSKDLARYLLRV